MKNLNKIVAAIAVMGSAASTVTHAQTLPTNASWYFAPSINAFDPDDRFGVDGNGKGIGLRFGKAIAPRWDIQLGPNFARRSAAGAKNEQLLLGADALYMFSRDTFRPFLLVGVGAERDKITPPAGFGSSFSKTSPYIDAGLGAQYSFSNRFMGQLDFRRVHGFVRDSGGVTGVNASNANYLGLGLGYAFGAAAPKAVPTPVPQVQMPILPPAPVYTPAPVAAPAPVIVQAPVPAPAPVQMPRVERITMSDTELFDFNKAQLRLPQPRLDELAATLASNPQINNVSVNGYTDRLGTDAYNRKLSQQRAEAVKAYLVSKGVESSRVRAVGHGEGNPVVQCTEKDRAALINCLAPNRRVEIEQFTVERTVQ